MDPQSVLAVIPTRTNLLGLRSVLTQLDRLQVPVRIYDNGHDQYDAQAFLHGRSDVVNARSWKFYKMWNDGWRYAAEHGYQTVAFLNDDITLADESLAEAIHTLTSCSEYGLVGLNWRRRVTEGVERDAGVFPVSGSYRTYGIGGWAFVMRSDLWGAIPPIDEAYHIWYGDDELFATVEAHGYRIGLAVGAPVDHEQSATCDLFPELMAKTREDHDRFVRRWGPR